MFNYFKKGTNSYGNETLVPNIAKMVTHGIIGLVVLVLFFGSFGTVGAGERGVKTRLNAVVGVVQPGLYFKMPIIEHVVIMDVRTQSLTSTTDQPLMAASNDLQDTRLAVVVNYHIDPSTVQDIYVQYGSAQKYYSQVVEPLIIATIKATASQYTAADQIQKRAEMSAKSQEALQAAFAGKSVAIEKTDITNIAFSDSFTQAIENKVTAVQNAEAAKNKLEQTKAEAQQTIVTAQAQAEAQRIQAQSLAAQGGADYVALKAVEKWDGHYPTTYMGNASQIPLIQIK